MSKKAFITGITGQDGAWLAKYLLSLGYEVHGGVRRVSNPSYPKLKYLGILDQITMHEFELSEFENMRQVIKDVMPEEFYNLAAQSFVGTSFKQPLTTLDIDGASVAKQLEIFRELKPDIRYYQASTSELFGKVQETPQSETTPFYPRSPYGVAKLYAHWMVRNYQESYNIFATAGILFNHESELRGQEFVTRKISMHAAAVAKGQDVLLELGNLDAKRDWGYAKEYVEGMHKILQADHPDVYVLATGETTSIRDFVTECYFHIGIELVWDGKDENEFATNKEGGKVLVKVNPKFYRPAEVDLLLGDAAKAEKELGWKAHTNAKMLAKLMVESDIRDKKDF
ncbi:GDP-mannose 4,6-dehydratase [bacterium]|nr:MAG: GDP-mannose 4,6-dehydratase [bacterium]